MSGIASSRDLKKRELFEDLCQSLDERFRTGEESFKVFPDWVNSVILDGKTFSWDHHEYLVEPYRDAHPFKVEMKAAQLGLTTKAILRALYLGRSGSLGRPLPCALSVSSQKA